MRSVSLLLLTVASTLLAVSGGADQSGTAGPLTVELVPQVVEATYYPEAIPPYYLWAFEAHITNHSDVPIRMISFSSASLRGTEWIMPDRTYGPKEFTEWYTDGDPVADGWIQPGETAVDARSWNKSYDPVIAPVKWFYRATTEDGREFLAEYQPELVPHHPQLQNWASRPGSKTASLSIEIESADGKPLGTPQVRFGREWGHTRALAVYFGAQVAAEVPLPGIYWIDVYALGHQPASFPLVLEDLTDRARLKVRLFDRTESRLPEISFDGCGPLPGEAVDFYRRWEPECEASLAERQAYREEHGTADGFAGTIPPTALELAEIAGNDSRPEFARFAVLMFLNSFVPAGAIDGARMWTLLPVDSPLWAFSPMAAGNATTFADDRVARHYALADSNSDRLVQATSLVSLAYGAKYEGRREDLVALLARLRENYTDLDEIRWQILDLEQAEPLVKGQPMPEFDVPTLDGTARISAASLRGEYYLLHFWASWCGPCMAEMPAVHEAYEKFSTSGVRFVSISMDRDRASLDRTRANVWPLPWTNAWSEDIPDFDDVFGVDAIPALYLVDPDGVIVASSQELRGEALEETLATFLEAR